jgi:hypothetical protein
MLKRKSSGTETVANIDESEFGAKVATTVSAKQIKLLPSRSVAVLRIPPVISVVSRPVKLLTFPVFPPILMMVFLSANVMVPFKGEDRSGLPCEFWILGHPSHEVDIQAPESVVHGYFIPVLRYSLPTIGIL